MHRWQTAGRAKPVQSGCEAGETSVSWAAEEARKMESGDVYPKQGRLRTGPPRAEKGVRVLSLPQFSRWTAQPSTETGSPSRSRPSSPFQPIGVT